MNGNLCQHERMKFEGMHHVQMGKKAKSFEQEYLCRGDANWLKHSAMIGADVGNQQNFGMFQCDGEHQVGRECVVRLK